MLFYSIYTMSRYVLYFIQIVLISFLPLDKKALNVKGHPLKLQQISYDSPADMLLYIPLV